MPFIQMLEMEDADDALKKVYQEVISKRGKLADVIKIQSLNPESIVKHMELYMTIMFGRSPLRRAQREMIAVVVSAQNQCKYCVQHHATALNHFWKNDIRLENFKKDFASVDLNKQEILLCEYAIELTQNPGQNFGDKVEQMKSAGLEDRAILDAALVISYFNFVNRMVMGLGVQIETAQGVGFNYD